MIRTWFPFPSSWIAVRNHNERGFQLGRWIGPLVGLASIAAAVAFASTTKKEPIPEDRSSPGYAIVRDPTLDDEIENYETVEPDAGWDSQYSINDGAVVMRFRETSGGIEMDLSYRRGNQNLADAIGRVADARGFIPN